jgi:hypothetical protein
VRWQTKSLFINSHVAEKKGEKLNVEHNAQVLICLDTGKPIEKGDSFRDLKGRLHKIVGGEAPTSPHYVGKVLTSDDQWMSPSALDLRWLQIVEHDKGEQTCHK